MSENEVIKQLEEYYNQYTGKMKALEQSRDMRSVFGGLLGNTGPGADSCNDTFYENVKLCLESFTASAPASGEVLAVMRFVLSRSGDGRGSAGLMLTAVHGCLIPAAGLLSAEHKREFLAEYLQAYPARRQFPKQKELARALGKN